MCLAVCRAGASSVLIVIAMSLFLLNHVGFIYILSLLVIATFRVDCMSVEHVKERGFTSRYGPSVETSYEDNLHSCMYISVR